ncbi:MAG: AraC family transcriptional regulator ligand-binding domain-containing protein [Polyangiales bacterium]
MQSYDIAGYHLRGMLQGFRRLGLDTDALLRQAQIESSILQNPEVRFDEAQVLALWMNAEASYAQPGFGLTLALHIPFGGLELVDYLVATCSSVGTGLECLDHHARLCASGFYFRIEEGGRESPGKLLYLEHRHGIELLPRSLVEYLGSMVITRLRAFCGPYFQPLFRLRQAPEGPSAAYRDAYGRAPELGAGDVLFVTDAQWKLENPRRDPTLGTLLHAHARDVCERLPEADFESRVRSAIVEALHLGRTSIQHVGARLALSPRTLQRRLEENGTTFQAVFDAVRNEFAVHYLSSTQLSLTEISHLLAYTDPSTFGRAFRRWTGTSPAEFRLHRAATSSGERAH